MFNEGFSHWLSYGATGQRTITELQGQYDGLVVPGTVAAFQHQGTGGFVLALSATVEGAPYVIDPRFPLFQQALVEPKRSHIALAEDVLQSPDLIRPTEPSPSDFDNDLVNRVADRWVSFNEAYQGSAAAKFDKYAERLGQPLRDRDSEAPAYILAPYVVATGRQDDWWDVSELLWLRTVHSASQTEVIRVVAAADVAVLGELLEGCGRERIVIWVSDLNAIDSPPEDLARYLQAISEAVGRGQRLFALYGGFFSVIASAAGLAGSAHGIGFGEYRAWPELPRSGPPPARFYLPRLHRYVSQEDAQRLWMADRDLAECDCGQCAGRAPLELEYHDLMKHSVESRAQEIQRHVGSGMAEIRGELQSELKSFRDELTGAGGDSSLWSRMDRMSKHMDRWIDAIEMYRTATRASNPT